MKNLCEKPFSSMQEAFKEAKFLLEPEWRYTIILRTLG